MPSVAQAQGRALGPADRDDDADEVGSIASRACVAARHTVFRAAERVRIAIDDHTRAAVKDGFRMVSRLGKFKDVPRG